MTDEPAPAPGGSGRTADDRERFERGVLAHLDAAWNLARHILRDSDAAEDAVQEAVLRAWRHFDGLRGADARPWLLTIVRNTCFTLLRRRRPALELVAFDEELHTPKSDAGPETEWARTQAADSVQTALAGLSPEFREVIVLRELEELSYREIAQVAGVPIGTVMSRLARARRQLSGALRGGDEREEPTP